jgi:hypothetical protein
VAGCWPLGAAAATVLRDTTVTLARKKTKERGTARNAGRWGCTARRAALASQFDRPRWPGLPTAAAAAMPWPVWHGYAAMAQGIGIAQTPMLSSSSKADVRCHCHVVVLCRLRLRLSQLSALLPRKY